MNAKSCLLLLAAAALLGVSAEAQTLEDCGLRVRPPQLSPSDKDPVVLTFLGEIDYCTGIRVAAVGEAGLLGLSQPAGALNIILAQRPQNDPEVACPAVIVPFEIEVRLPEKLPDGCAVNQRYWVIGAAATNVRFTLRITDTQTGAVWEHTKPGEHLTPAFADVQAFPCAAAR